MLYLHFRIGRKEENKENGLEGALSGRAEWGVACAMVRGRGGDGEGNPGGGKMGGDEVRKWRRKVQRKGPDKKANTKKIKDGRRT